jgi:hypothetical protein
MEEAKSAHLGLPVNYCYLCFRWMDQIKWAAHCAEHLSEPPPVDYGLFTVSKIVLWPGRCPFCLVDPNHPPQKRWRNWECMQTFRKHISQHIESVKRWPAQCPLPQCSQTRLTSSTEMMGHMADVHHINLMDRVNSRLNRTSAALGDRECKDNAESKNGLSPTSASTPSEQMIENESYFAEDRSSNIESRLLDPKSLDSAAYSVDSKTEDLGELFHLDFASWISEDPENEIATCDVLDPVSLNQDGIETQDTDNNTLHTIDPRLFYAHLGQEQEALATYSILDGTGVTEPVVLSDTTPEMNDAGGCPSFQATENEADLPPAKRRKIETGEMSFSV